MLTCHFPRHPPSNPGSPRSSATSSPDHVTQESQAIVELAYTSEELPSDVETGGYTIVVPECPVSSNQFGQNGSMAHQQVYPASEIHYASDVGTTCHRVVDLLQPAYLHKSLLGVQDNARAVNHYSAANGYPVSRQHSACIPPTQYALSGPLSAVAYPRPIIQLQQWAHETRDEYLALAEIMQKSTWETPTERTLVLSGYDVVQQFGDDTLGLNGVRKRL